MCALFDAQQNKRKNTLLSLQLPCTQCNEQTVGPTKGRGSNIPVNVLEKGQISVEDIGCSIKFPRNQYVLALRSIQHSRQPISHHFYLLNALFVEFRQTNQLSFAGGGQVRQ